MVLEIEAVYEDGVLRPLGPLALAEHQKVHVTVSDVPKIRADFADESSLRRAQTQWRREHAHKYRGEWIALDGTLLLSHGTDRKRVTAEARQSGADRPYIDRILEENPELPLFF